MKTLILSMVAATVVFSGSQVEAQFQNTPFDMSTWVPSRPDEPTSNIQLVTPPGIDGNGNIWSGSGSGGGDGRIVGRAKRHVDSQGRGWYVSNYSNRYGKVTPRRAPKFDSTPYQPSDRYGSAVTISNPTSSHITFRFRLRKRDNWQTIRLQPNTHRTFNIHDLVSVYPTVGFDSNTAPGEQFKTVMIRYGTIDKRSKNQYGPIYEFNIDGYGNVNVAMRR